MTEDSSEIVSAVIEISMNSGPIKYEIDKNNMVHVDRFINVAMQYPCNYGFIPNTLGGDGDCCDILIITSAPLIIGCSIKCRVVGSLVMEDEGGKDEKIIAVPISKIDPSYDFIKDIEDVSQVLKDKIKHFFEHYKDMEKNKWVKIRGWIGKKETIKYIESAKVK